MGVRRQRGLGLRGSGERDGLTLNEYMQKYLLQPLGLHNRNLSPTREMRAKVSYCHVRQPEDGVLRYRNHLQRAPLVVGPGQQHGGGGADLQQRRRRLVCQATRILQWEPSSIAKRSSQY